MNLTRKYKIHRLTPCLNEQELEIINFIESKIKGLEAVKNDKNPKSTFYINSKGQIILERDDKNDILWVRYKDFWKVLEEKYLLKYADVQDIIQLLVSIHLKFRSSTPQIDLTDRMTKGIDTPQI
jgi:hypothetical protein